MEENNEAWLRQVNSELGGFGELVGLRAEVVRQGYCRLSCDIQPKHCNPRGTVHGGMSATMLDTAGGVAAIFSGEAPRPVVTQSASAHYLRPLSGSKIIAEAQVVKAGHRTCLTRADLYDDQHRLCCTGEIELFFID